MELKELTGKVLGGGQITREEALFLNEQPLEELCESADMIRRHFCANQFDICTIINGKSGRCSENCKFCAQSAHNDTCITEYPLLSADEILAQAKLNHEQVIFSLEQGDDVPRFIRSDPLRLYQILLNLLGNHNQW